MQKFFVQNEKYLGASGAFISLRDKDKGWCWTIYLKARASYPAKKKNSHKNLNARPEQEFFARTEFYSSLKNEIISKKVYANVKIFWNVLRL